MDTENDVVNTTEDNMLLFFSDIDVSDLIDLSENTNIGLLIAQIYAVCCFSAIVGLLAYMTCCVPNPEDVERRRRKKEILDYNKSFTAELEELDERELSVEELKALVGKLVEDETPYGKVIMTYNHEYESYWYYSDNKNIPYMTLDVLARQFAVKYDCKAICVNYKEEWEKSKAAALSQKEQDKKDEKEKKEKKENDTGKRDVFANFKSYNTNQKRTDSIKRRRYRIMTDRSNRFSHKGMLEDYKKLREPKQKQSGKNNISFSEFKAKLNWINGF